MARPERRVPRAFQPPPPDADDPVALSRLAVESALRRGFAAAGVVAAGPPVSWERYRAWLDAGYHGEMSWLERDAAARQELSSILPWCRSVVVVAREVPPGDDGNVARYARGEDYHRILRRELHDLADDLRPHAPAGTHFRVCVDTAPVLERELAVRAGLGSLGKNGLLIVPGVGSHVVLGELLTDVDMAGTAVLAGETLDVCGSCARCLEACPTQAFVEPRVLDARRCLSYLTIEKRTPFTPGEESALEGRLFGCDVCQDVCPWNAPFLARPAAGVPASLDPRELAGLDDEGFAERFAQTALFRATREGLARNARASLTGCGGAAR